MKALATLFLVIGMSYSSFAWDKSLKEVSSVETQEQRFIIKLAEYIGKVRISIYDKNNFIISRNFFTVDGPQNIPFNLSSVPEGQYRVKLETKEEAQSFEINSFKKVEKKLLAYAKPIDDNSFNLKVLGLTDPGTEVTIYRTDHKVLLKDKIQEEGGFSKNYKLKFLKLHQVYLKVENEGKKKFLYFD